MEILLQQIINGITVGCLYALMALGYSMVYGVLKMVNFAHGELFMLGPMFSLFMIQELGIVQGRTNSMVGNPNTFQIIGILALCFILGMVFSAIMGLVMERLVYRSLRNRNAPMEISMIAAMGLSLFLQNATMLVFGHEQKGYPSILTFKSFTVGGANFSNMQLFILGFVVILLFSLSYLVNKTYVGRNFRAVALDRCASGLMGVNVNAIVAFVFILGPAIGAASGVLYAMTYSQVYYLMGVTVGMKGWIAAIIGGIGNIKGAVVGGFLLGMFEVIGAGYLPLLTGGALGAEYRNIFAFVMLIVVLLVRPQGLYGKRGVA
jgi:branched-chain amino acid transport system permease protein